MSSFAILKRLRALDVNAELNQVLKSLESQIIALNTDEQLFKKGITISGAKIVPKYAQSTIKRKRKLGQPTNRVTTRDTGGYHQAFDVRFGQTEFEIVVEFQTNRGFDLAGYLETHYKGLEGLTEESINKLIGLVKPLLINEIKRKL